MAHGEHLLDSGALQTLNEVLGATGGEQHTYVDSSHLQLAMDANDIIRRGRTLAASEGVFTARLTNTHVAGADVFTSVNPYAVAGTAGWPNPIPRGLDVWYLGSSSYRFSGAALVAAMMGMDNPATRMAFSGTAAQIFTPFRVYNIATLGEVTAAGITNFRSVGDGLIGKLEAIRIPRGANLFWSTTNGAAAAVYITELLLGLFPAGLGQDAIGAG